MPGVTTQQAPYGKSATVQQAVTLNGGLCVARTARIETAVVAQPGTEQQAICVNYLDGEPAHLSINCSQSFSNAASSTLPD